MRRARETAGFIASAIGVPVREDGRLQERMNWDGAQPFEEFLADWAASVRDRSFPRPATPLGRPASGFLLFSGRSQVIRDRSRFAPMAV
jgi:broad specificity phosphatase PhoE